MKNSLVNCLIEKSNITVTFSKSQWDAYVNNETNLLAIKLKNDFNIGNDFSLDRYAKDNKVNFKYKKFVVFGLSLLFVIVNYNINAYADVPGAEGLQRFGETFIELIQLAGYWICFARGLIDIIKEVLKGGDKSDGIGKILIRYTLAFASFYLLPVLFNLIRNSFTVVPS